MNILLLRFSLFTQFWPFPHFFRIFTKKIDLVTLHEPSEENEMIRFLPPLQHHGGLFYGSMRPKYVDSGR